MAFDLDRLALQIEPADRGPRAAGRLDHAREHFQRGGFARAVGPEKPHDLPGPEPRTKARSRQLAAKCIGKRLDRDHATSFVSQTWSRGDEKWPGKSTARIISDTFGGSP